MGYPLQIETREQRNPTGRLLLKQFENGELSSEALDVWASFEEDEDDYTMEEDDLVEEDNFGESS